MSEQDVIETIVHNDRQWYKIAGDTAFIDILEGFEQYRPVYQEHVNEFKIAVQAGGYCGIFPRLLSEMFQTVYTFEPDGSNFTCLSLNCLNEGVVKAQGALGNEHGLVTVTRRLNSNRGMNHVQHTVNSKIPTYIIDELELPDCNLIQLDTEGYEFKILQGARNTIERFNPLISVEDTTPQIKEYLDQFGYNKIGEVYRDTVYKCER